MNQEDMSLKPTGAQLFPQEQDIISALYWPRGYKTFFKLTSAEHEI